MFVVFRSKGIVLQSNFPNINNDSFLYLLNNLCIWSNNILNTSIM